MTPENIGEVAMYFFTFRPNENIPFSNYKLR